jgi:hypothetical protein
MATTLLRAREEFAILAIRAILGMEILIFVLIDALSLPVNFFWKVATKEASAASCVFLSAFE